MPETWTDPAAQERYRNLLAQRLNAPAGLREPAPEPAGEPDGAAEDRRAAAVGPPLYGSHHTGEQTVPAAPDSWMATLNLEVRRRVAAALGARYVQLEQEFLMARAWEQAGEIRQANRLLATGELAAAAAERAKEKHLGPLGLADLVTLLAPVGERVTVSAVRPDADATTLATMLASADEVPTGAASTSFSRLTRANGALSRRAHRGTDGESAPAEPVLVQSLRTMGATVDEAPGSPGLPTELRDRLSPTRLQVLRMADRVPGDFWAQRTEDASRPLRPIMTHPRFTVPIATELLSRWPEWALPGIESLPPDSVTLVETNPEFIAALLVGLNHEFNRELLWREFPTDQRGTPFARFWPSDDADVEEIALWPTDAPLGSRLHTGREGDLALLVRGTLLSRFPGTSLVAVAGVDGRLPPAFDGVAATPMVLDESTVLYLFAGLDEERARTEDWFFVFREPMQGTRFGFDTGPPPLAMENWSDLTWEGLGVDVRGSVVLDPAPTAPSPAPDGSAVWAADAADMARIAFQQPFQLAFRASRLLGG